VFGRRKRRRIRREPAGWLGRYGPERSSAREWSRCRVLDVSTGGAALELLGTGVGVGERVVVDLQLLRTNTARITLTGEVRHARLLGGGMRVGVRFVDVGELEQTLLARLVVRQKHERRHPGVVTPFPRRSRPLTPS
jgi:c-di-GMP-binding flagellar brake protein YcgR